MKYTKALFPEKVGVIKKASIKMIFPSEIRG